jgi:hypothetical protein
LFRIVDYAGTLRITVSAHAHALIAAEPRETDFVIFFLDSPDVSSYILTNGPPGWIQNNPLKIEFVGKEG